MPDAQLFIATPKTYSRATKSGLKRNPSCLNSPEKILFICSRNRWRSLTAEKLFSDVPGLQVRSAGTREEARIVVTEGHIRWADRIFVMEKAHLSQLRSKFPEAIEGKQVVNLQIPDDYTYMQPELVDELAGKMGAYITLPDSLR